jgi:hypothetical protein
MAMDRRAGYSFFAIGIAFIAIGATGRRPFLAIGIAFLVMGLIQIRRG